MRIERVVVNASPLITLFRSHQADLLPRLFSEILVPEAVWQEVVESDHEDVASVGSVLHIMLMPVRGCNGRENTGWRRCGYRVSWKTTASLERAVRSADVACRSDVRRDSFCETLLWVVIASKADKNKQNQLPTHVPRNFETPRCPGGWAAETSSR
jgi:hypothetical protein